MKIMLHCGENSCREIIFYTNMRPNHVFPVKVLNLAELDELD